MVEAKDYRQEIKLKLWYLEFMLKIFRKIWELGKYENHRERMPISGQN